MYLINFWVKYPELAKKETRIITILSDKEKIPKWEYAIAELYCTNPNCDCRKVSLNVIWPNNKTYYLNYWFEKPSYYIKWGIWDIEIAKEMSWLSVNEFEWNHLESELVLDTMDWVLNDTIYVERLKKHYKLMKEDVEWYENPLPFKTMDYGNAIFNDSEIDIWNINKYKNLVKRKLKDKKKKKLAKKQKIRNKK